MICFESASNNMNSQDVVTNGRVPQSMRHGLWVKPPTYEQNRNQSQSSATISWRTFRDVGLADLPLSAANGAGIVVLSLQAYLLGGFSKLACS